MLVPSFIARNFREMESTIAYNTYYSYGMDRCHVIGHGMPRCVVGSTQTVGHTHGVYIEDWGDKIAWIKIRCFLILRETLKEWPNRQYRPNWHVATPTWYIPPPRGVGPPDVFGGAGPHSNPTTHRPLNVSPFYSVSELYVYLRRYVSFW